MDIPRLQWKGTGSLPLTTRYYFGGGTCGNDVAPTYTHMLSRVFIDTWWAVDSLRRHSLVLVLKK